MVYAQWIDKYEGLYKIDILGNVERYYKNGNTKILKNNNDGNGYKKINLYKNGKATTHRIHRLLALHFIDNPNQHPFVDHIDINCQNNNLQNLRWVTISMNNRNCKNKGKYMKGVTKNKNGKKFMAKIKINKKDVYLGTFNTELEAHNCYMIEYNKIMNEFS